MAGWAKRSCLWLLRITPALGVSDPGSPRFGNEVLTLCFPGFLPQNHWFTYNETMTVESVTQAVSNLALQFGEEDADPGAMSRPFGVALLFGGVDEKGPQLFHMDPSGTFVQCDARAIGSASEGAQSSLQEVYHKSMTLKEAIKSSLVILKQVMEEKLNATNIELATVEPGLKFHMYTKEELEEVIKDI